jgi:hypothetical protein
MAKEATTADINVDKEMDELRRVADSAGEIEVSLDADDDDDEVVETEAQQGPSRQDKKRQRGQNLVQQARDEAETARREAAELRGRLDTLERQRQQPAPQQPTRDPLEDEAVSVRREHAAYVTRYQDALNRAAQEKRQLAQNEVDAYEKEGWDLKDRMDDLGYRRAAKRHAQPGISAAQIQQQAQIARVQQLHGDLLSVPKSQQLFMAHWQLKLAEGRPDTEDTMNAAAESARVALGVSPRNGRPPPTQGQKARLSGSPKGGGVATGNEGGNLVLTKELKRMADASLAHIRDPKERYKVFARTVGKDLRKDGLA